MEGKSRFLAFFVAVITATLGVKSVNPQPKPAQRHAAENHSTSTSQMAAEAGLLKTFSDFDKTAEYVSPLDASAKCAAPPANRLARQMDWAIATVPDPERSNLKLDFDREVEAIQNAAGSAGYQFERFWFPWRESAASDAAQAGESDSLPGVLLFHQAAKDSREAPALAIFLVGETPTSGVNPGQFAYASCLGSSLQQVPGRPNTLHIIGPGYSASFDSLARLTKGSPGLTLRSWTSDLSSQQVFKKQTGADLRTTRNPSIVSINSFVAFLRQQWHETGPVVILKEEGTALGAGIARRNCDAEPHQPDQTHIEDCRVYSIEFPRNLSTLRNASESEAVATSAAAAKSEMPKTGLTFSLRGGDASFEIPRFSQAQTPVSQESVLFSIASLLKTGAVHYAGIIASDPLDVLYLSRYLRSACPNLRLFTLDPDLLFEHGSDSKGYEGVLSVSTYPLFPVSQLWSGSNGVLQIFPSENYEGIYNAVLSSLAALDPKRAGPSFGFVDTRNPFRTMPGEQRQLPLWLTVAGRSGFEPVTMLPSADDRLTIHPKSGISRLSPEYWDSWGYAFLVVLAAGLFFCFALAAASPDGERTLAIFAVKPKESAAASRGFYLAAIGASLSLLTLVWLIVPGQIVFENLDLNQATPAGRSFALRLFCIGLLASATVFASTARRRHGDSTVRIRWSFKNFLSPKPPVPITGFSCSTAILAASFLFDFQDPFRAPATPALETLWRLFGLGSFVLGAIVAATACPVCDLIQTTAFSGANTSVRTFPWRPRLGAIAFAGLTSIAIAATFSYFLLQKPYNDPAYFLAACRALDLTSGVSPLVPVSLLVIALVSLALVQLRRTVYYEERCPVVPELQYDPFVPSLGITMQETRERTGSLAFHPVHAFALAALALLIYCVRHNHSHETLENWLLENVLIYGSILGGFFLVLAWLRVLLMWVSFSEFLQQLERHPMRSVFSLLPKDFVWSPVWQGGGKKRTHVVITRSLECIQALENHEATPWELKAAIKGRICLFKRQVKDLLLISASRRRVPPSLYRDLEANLSAIATAAAAHLEREQWSSGSYELRSELAAKDQTRDALRISKDDFEEQEPATICGELVGFRFLAFINYVLWQIDNLIGFVSFGFLLLVIAMNTYDFRSRTIVDWMLVGMFLLLTTGIMTVFAQAARDAILSRITGTQEGKLDRNFFVHLVSYGGLPLIALTATHFPAIGTFLFSWVKPALEAIH